MDSVGVHSLGSAAAQGGQDTYKDVLQRAREWVTLHQMGFGPQGIAGHAPSLRLHPDAPPSGGP